jgi:phage/plasmid-like protein (TIGR03299 family)
MATFAITDNLSWDVEKRPLYFTGNDGSPVPVSEKVAVVRCDTGAFLGAVSPDYEIVQNSVLLDMIQPMIDEGLLEISNVGYLNGGARVFAQAVVNEEFNIAGDTYKSFITLLNGHVGNCSVAIGPSNVRVICGNSFSMNYSQLGEKFRHSAGVNERVLESKSVLEYVNGAMAKYAKYMEPLSLKPCSSAQFRNAVEKIYNKPIEKMRESFVSKMNDLFYRGTGNEGKTFSDAFNACTEFSSHHARKTAAGNFYYASFGAGAVTNRRAMQVLTEMAAV